MDETDEQKGREELLKIINEEIDKKAPKKMNDVERIQNARDIRDIIHQNMLSAENASSGVADEFIRLQVTIATIVFAFASLFLNDFTEGLPSGISDGGFILMKLAFAFSLVSLIASLAFGLFHLKRKEMFWDEMLGQRIIRFKKWNKASRREVSFEEADAFQDGTSLEKGNVVSVPVWAWRLQTICLVAAIIVLYVLVMILLFARHDIVSALPVTK